MNWSRVFHRFVMGFVRFDGGRRLALYRVSQSVRQPTAHVRARRISTTIKSRGQRSPVAFGREQPRTGSTAVDHPHESLDL